MATYFKTKPIGLLLEEMKGENRPRRVLGPAQLTSLGVGIYFAYGRHHSVLTRVAKGSKGGGTVPGAAEAAVDIKPVG